MVVPPEERPQLFPNTRKLIARNSPYAIACDSYAIWKSYKIGTRGQVKVSYLGSNWNECHDILVMRHLVNYLPKNSKKVLLNLHVLLLVTVIIRRWLQRTSQDGMSYTGSGSGSRNRNHYTDWPASKIIIRAKHLRMNTTHELMAIRTSFIFWSCRLYDTG